MAMLLGCCFGGCCVKAALLGVLVEFWRVVRHCKTLESLTERCMSFAGKTLVALWCIGRVVWKS